MTVTGLSSTNLSTITGFQQSILFVLMLLGDIVRKTRYNPSLYLYQTRDDLDHGRHRHGPRPQVSVKYCNILGLLSIKISKVLFPR